MSFPGREMWHTRSDPDSSIFTYVTSTGDTTFDSPNRFILLPKVHLNDGPCQILINITKETIRNLAKKNGKSKKWKEIPFVCEIFYDAYEFLLKFFMPIKRYICCQIYKNPSSYYLYYYFCFNCLLYNPHIFPQHKSGKNWRENSI